MKLSLKYSVALFVLFLFTVTSCQKEDVIDNELIEKAAKVKPDRGQPKAGDEVGDLNHGGIIFWVDPEDPNHGMVCALSDVVVDNGLKGKKKVTTRSWPWGCNRTLINGATGESIGTGKQNTIDIINGGCDVEGTAAYICNNFSLNGYDDWFLPSYLELDEMFNKLKKYSTNGNFFNTQYWSSTQVSGTKYERIRDPLWATPFTLSDIVTDNVVFCTWECDWDTKETELGYFFAKGIDFAFGWDFLDCPCPGLRTKNYRAHVRPVREYWKEN